MNIEKILPRIFIVYLFVITLPTVDAAPVMKIRAEGASRIGMAGSQKALQNAKSRALEKAFKSHLDAIVLLTAQERDAMVQTLLDRQEQFLRSSQTVTKSSDREAVRVVLELELLSEPFLRILIDAGYLSRFKHKPRLVIALDEQHKSAPNPNRPFAALLGQKLAELNIPVIPASLPGQPQELGDADIAKAVQSSGGDVAIVGQSLTEMLKVGGTGIFQSCRAEIAIRALRSDTGEILSAMQQGVAGLGVSETAAIKKAFSQISSETIDNFAKEVLTKWIVAVAKQEIQPSPVAVGTPPQLTIDSPVPRELIEGEMVRLQGSVSDDKGIRSVQLFVNGTAVSLVGGTHLVSERSVAVSATGASSADDDAKAYQVSRLIALKLGENTIRLVALDTDNNAEEVTRTVLRMADAPESSPERMTSANIDLEIHTPKDGETIENEWVIVKGHAKSDQKLAGFKVLVNGSDLFTPRQFVVEGLEEEMPTETEITEPASNMTEAVIDPNNLAIQQTVWLSPGSNRIEVIATTEDGSIARRELTVTQQTRTTGQAVGASVSQKYAVIIGIGKYQDSRIPRLRYTRADAEGMYQYLIDPKRGGFPPENVRLLVDEEATLRNLRSTIGRWLAERVKPEDVVLLFYSGHGGLETDLSGESGDGKNRYLINYDADADDLYATAMPNPELGLMLARIRSQQLIFLLDCCYSGGVASGEGVIKSFNPSASVVKSDVYAPFAGQGRVVISASRADQISFEVPQLEHGIFTYHLLRGLGGEADLDKNGTVTLFELYPYLVKAVEETAQRTVGRSQTPTLMGTIVGDLTLATPQNK
ncbi:MAG: caspase family protein [Candidatus Poribacteria bacterium]|nr:caspase family protein [Candidatus Poribacteria bacterium]